MTNYAQWLGVWVTNDTTLFPQASLDSGDSVDLGYHYAPIDYMVAMAVSNATVTVLPGTILAACGAQYGAYLYTNANITCQGTATSPVWFVRYNTVQEQSNTNGESGIYTWDGIVLHTLDSTSSQINFNFTDDADFDDSATTNPITVQNCQFYNGTVVPFGVPFSATNCLFRRVEFDGTDRGAGNINIMLCNNLFVAGELILAHFQTGNYAFQNNLLDQTAVTTVASSNNAYVTTNYGVVTPENNDVILSNSPAFEAGILGQYYYPTNLTNLIFKGSELASAVGLYHYTMTTNNAIEGTNIVSIGFHFVACGANGLPLDANGDGIPDYLEDINGNGVVDSGEIGWQATNDLGLTVIITQPANNSIIP
ncbi:MAG TPA: hypothetical protein VGN23_02830 [Verrucomicrobiae bacterium]|jgi:hypothetical protein